MLLAKGEKSMKRVELLLGVAVLGGWLGGGLPSAHASATTVTTYRTPQTFLPVHAGNTYVWNASHTRVRANLKHYQKTTLYATKKVRLTGRGTYYAVHSANRRVSGYVATGQLIAGRYYAGGYYRYPTKHILLSTDPYRGTQDGPTGQHMYGQFSKTGMRPYTRQPSIAQMKRVLSYYKDLKRADPLPSAIAWKARSGARVVLEDQPTKRGSAANHIRVPMLERYDGAKHFYDWSTRADYWVAKDLALVKGHALATYDLMGSARYTVAFGGFYYDFPDTRAQFVSAALGSSIQAVYGHGYGPKHDLTLVNRDGHPRYVTTANLFSIPADKPVLKHGIWYATQYVAPEQLTQHLDATKSRYYRLFDGAGFTQYHFVAGQWTEQWSVRFDTKGFKQVTITLTPAADKAAARHVATIDRSDAALLRYLYKPVSDYQAFLK